MSTYGIHVPSSDQINYHEAHQQQRVQAALTSIDPGDVLAVIDSRIAAEADPQAHPRYTQPRSTYSHSTCFLFRHRTSSFPRLTAVSSILALLIFAQIALVSTSSAQNCQYSPYWGENGELWDPSGPLKDYSSVGYHQGEDPIPYQQRSASQSFGPGRFTITDRMIITEGVLRGAGKDQTTLYFPQGLVGMGYRGPYANGTWDWQGAVVELRGTEVGLEDLTIEFGPHAYQHHSGHGFNGVVLRECSHCWVANVRVINADDAFGIMHGHHNTLEQIEAVGGHHIHVHMSVTQQNLVNDLQVSGGSHHGLTGNWGTQGGVYANVQGGTIVIEPDHNGPTTTGLLYSNIQGTYGNAEKMSDTFLWNFLNQDLCPLDIYQAQLANRLGEPPPDPDPDSCPFDNLARCATASASSVWSASYTAVKANDGSGSTRWNSANGDTVGAWLALDFGALQPFNRIVLKEALKRITGYALQHWDGSGWQDIVSGTSIDANKTHTFAPMTAQRVRLFVISTVSSRRNGTPTIAEFEVYNQE